jgi:hypothetical protein
MPRRQGFDDRAQFYRRQKAGQPSALGVRVAVDLGAELQREAGLAGAGAADQRVDGNVDLVVDPRLKLGKEVFAADQRQLPGFGDEQIKLARRLARRDRRRRSGGRNCRRRSGRTTPESPKVRVTVLPSPVTTTLWLMSRPTTDLSTMRAPPLLFVVIVADGQRVRTSRKFAIMACYVERFTRRTPQSRSDENFLGFPSTAHRAIHSIAGCYCWLFFGVLSPPPLSRRQGFRRLY